MRSPIRRRCVALAALSTGILVTTGCGTHDRGPRDPDARELFLQPAAAPGPDPFTESTAALPRSTDNPSSLRPSVPRDAAGPDGPGELVRALPGSTPGLYAGARARSSCDVERQVRFLTEDRRRAVAFSRGAGVSRASVPDFLRGLTPVVLRADIRVTSHSFRAGTAIPFQSVLQTGTAVMVDNHGLPRVRCAAGSPLRAAVPLEGSVVHKGERWPGYRPERVIVINRAPETVASLVIMNTHDNTWIERATGTDGDQDRLPAVPPPYGPDADLTDPGLPRPVPSDEPSGDSEPAARSTDAAEPGLPGGTTGTGPADCPAPGQDQGWDTEPLSVPSHCPILPDEPLDGAGGPLLPDREPGEPDGATADGGADAGEPDDGLGDLPEDSGDEAAVGGLLSTAPDGQGTAGELVGPGTAES